MNRWKILQIHTLFNTMETGTLLYVKDYVFENGESKDKFFLILKKISDDQKLIISLPSSQDYVPSPKYDCVDIPAANQSAFIFKENDIITNKNFYFDKKTYLYGQYVTIKFMSDFFLQYPIEGVHYENKGKLKSRILDKVLECFKNSCTVPRKIKKIL